MAVINQAKQTSKIVNFKNSELFAHICGIADKGVNALEKLLEISIVPRGSSFTLISNNLNSIERAEKFFNELQASCPDPNRMPDEFDLQYILRNLSIESDSGNKKKDKQYLQSVIMKKNGFAKNEILTTNTGQKIYPRTRKQTEFVESILENQVTICTGPAGTGKTFLSTALACRLFKQGQAERIVLTRPAVEAGESLGFLPGDLNQKVDPYLRPLFDSLYECLGYDKVHKLIELRKIEIAPLAFMRGRSLNNSVIILDEAQNCTLPQLKMFLTRLGQDSRMCISGDNTQVDLSPGKSGLIESGKILQNIPQIGLIQFGPEDIIRNPLVEQIVNAFENN